MPAYHGAEQARVEASPQACFDALTDYEHLHEWQPVLRDVTVRERDEQGRGSVVDYTLDAKVKTVRYSLRLRYDEPHAISSEYLGGDFRNFAAEWRFEDLGDGTTEVSLTVDIDPGRFVPGALRSRIRDFVMSRAVRDLQEHLEGARAER
jgi:ribosome-associated toxin RatA of RatAB toxin-antitoxin module